MPAVQARIVNTDHENTTLSVYEDLPSLSWTFKRSDVSTASWTVPFSHLELDREGFGPKRTDFRIGVSVDNGVNWNTVHAGILGPVGLDTDKDSVDVAGVDWAEWLNQSYRFDGYQKDFETELIRKEDVAVVWGPGTDVNDIIDNLIANLCSGTELECVQITASYSGTGWTTVPVVSFTLSNQTIVLDEIKKLGELQEPDGYEFRMESNKVFKVFYGRQFKATPESSLPGKSRASFAPSLDNIRRLQWVNNGPKAITTVGMPITFPGQKGFSTYAPSVAVYRDWWQMIKVGGIKDIITADFGYIDSYTATYAYRDRFPLKNLTMTFDPTEVTPLNETNPHPYYWFENRTGYIIHVDSEDWWIDYWRINDYYWIIDQTLTHDDAGNWLCVVTLEQTNASA